LDGRVFRAVAPVVRTEAAAEDPSGRVCVLGRGRFPGNRQRGAEPNKPTRARSVLPELPLVPLVAVLWVALSWRLGCFLLPPSASLSLLACQGRASSRRRRTHTTEEGEEMLCDPLEAGAVCPFLGVLAPPEPLGTSPLLHDCCPVSQLSHRSEGTAARTAKGTVGTRLAPFSVGSQLTSS
jgi:hypothetical protein